MSRMYSAECQIFPGNDKIQITLTPIDDDKPNYEIRCPIDEAMVDELLRTLGCKQDDESYFNYRDLFKNSQEDTSEPFGVAEEFLTSLIQSFDPASFTDSSMDDSSIFIIESLKIIKPLRINTTLYEKGTIRFYYKGTL